MIGHSPRVEDPEAAIAVARDAARGAGHQVQAVGRGRAEDRAEVVRAQHGVGSVEQRVVERQLVRGVEAERGVARALEEAVHPPAVALDVRRGPRVRGVGAPQRGPVEHRVPAAGRVGLGEAGRRAEAAALHLRREAEVAVEGAVLLAGDHEVADRGVAAPAAPAGARRVGAVAHTDPGANSIPTPAAPDRCSNALRVNPRTRPSRLVRGQPLRRRRAERGEEAVAERAHRPDRRLRARQQAVLPAPSGDLVHHLRVVGDDRDRHVVGGALAGDDRGLMVAQEDDHELVVAVVLHVGDDRAHRVLDRMAVGGAGPIGVAEERGPRGLLRRDAVEDRAVADRRPRG